MATANPTGADERTARVHQLAAEGRSNRSIGRELRIAHTTVARILRTTTAPAAPVEPAEDAPAAPVERTAPEPAEQAERTTTAPPAPVERTTPAPPAPTSGNARTPRLLHPLDLRTIQDLNVLMDPRTGALPAPLARIIRAAADHRRTAMQAVAHRYAAEDAPPRPGAHHPRPPVAP
ncbi:hypothetical protein [Streptomyces sp. NPDC056188]|uniref:helix-turn-helix domain-containing protein n=1 Tax=Streptomyces sp. NPDC056188 TaxID=3345740 RepID=UPI0035D87424